MPKEGGTAVKLSSPAGVEIFPKFSPDGKNIAFTGNYDGNNDVYVIPVSGGVPVRLTLMAIPIVLLTGPTTAKKYYLLLQEKAAKQDSTNSIQFLPVAV